MSVPRLYAPVLAASAFVLGMTAQTWAVTVDMTNQKDGAQVMRLDRAEVPAGKVSFKVKNTSPDLVHEFLVVPTELTPDRLPMAKDGSRIDEKKLKGVKELGDLKPGENGTLTLDLKPGHYVVFCNEPGHFKGGMHAELTVA